MWTIRSTKIVQLSCLPHFKCHLLTLFLSFVFSVNIQLLSPTIKSKNILGKKSKKNSQRSNIPQTDLQMLVTTHVAM